MTQSAWTREGAPVDAGMIPADAWEALKRTYTMGDFQMPCCKAAAVPKTSINGLPFFAHYSDERATAPETVWHKAGKAAVLAGLASLGIQGREEVPGQSGAGDK